MSEKPVSDDASAATDEVTPFIILQCDPGLRDYRKYTFSQGVTQLGYMIVARNRQSATGYQTGTEYWFLNSVPQARETTTVVYEDYDWTTPPALPPGSASFTMPQNATWNAQPPSASDPLLYNNQSPAIGIQWKLTQSGSTWGGSIIWSRTTPRAGTNPNTLFAGAPATQTFTYSSTVPSALTYNAPVTPR